MKPLRLHLLPPILLLLCAESSVAQQTMYISPVESALGGPSAARIESPWHMRANPASLLGTRRHVLMLSFSPFATGLDGFFEGGMVAAVPIDSLWIVGITAEATEVQGYGELVISGAVAVELLGGVMTGISVSYHSLRIDRYGSAGGVSLGIGAIAQVDQQIRIGGSFKNVANGQIGTSDLPQQLTLGFAFEVDPGTTLSIDVSQELRRSPILSLGLSTPLLEELVIRAGVAHAPARISLGLGFEIDGIIVDYSGAFVWSLGVRQVIGLGIHL